MACRPLRGRRVSASSDVSMIVHGTTLVTNAVIERKGTPTGMLVTRGFRDMLDIALEQRYDLFDLRIRFPAAARAARRCASRSTSGSRRDGTVRRPARFERPAGSACATLVDGHGVKAVAVCFLHSYANAAHEQRASQRGCSERFPALRVSASSVVFPFAREYQRWTTTCLNAYVQPLVDRYIGRLERGLAVRRLQRALPDHELERRHADPGDGAALPGAAARIRPRRRCADVGASQPLARHAADRCRSTWAARRPRAAWSATTAPLKRYELEVARVHEFKRGSGLPVKIPVIDMIEIGAGGGSIADIDERGVLRVGPRSAGADPGPGLLRARRHRADADRRQPRARLPRRDILPRRAACRSTRRRPQAAHRRAHRRAARRRRQRAPPGAIHEVINEDVAKAFRVHASERGVDYRRCSMIVFGGSGPIHGARIARKLRMPQVVCPSGAGVMSAFGLLSSPVGFEQVQSLRVALADLTRQQFTEIVAGLVDRIREELIWPVDGRKRARCSPTFAWTCATSARAMRSRYSCRRLIQRMRSLSSTYCLHNPTPQCSGRALPTNRWRSSPGRSKSTARCRAATRLIGLGPIRRLTPRRCRGAARRILTPTAATAGRPRRRRRLPRLRRIQPLRAGRR